MCERKAQRGVFCKAFLRFFWYLSFSILMVLPPAAMRQDCQRSSKEAAKKQQRGSKEIATESQNSRSFIRRYAALLYGVSSRFAIGNRIKEGERYV